jgi:hypothetical protein
MRLHPIPKPSYRLSRLNDSHPPVGRSEGWGDWETRSSLRRYSGKLLVDFRLDKRPHEVRVELAVGGFLVEDF